jgi:hypothetical protein
MLIYEPKHYPDLNWKIGDTVITHGTNKIVGKVYRINHPFVYFELSPDEDDDSCAVDGSIGYYSPTPYNYRTAAHKSILINSSINYPKYYPS